MYKDKCIDIVFYSLLPVQYFLVQHFPVENFPAPHRPSIISMCMFPFTTFDWAQFPLICLCNVSVCNILFHIFQFNNFVYSICGITFSCATVPRSNFIVPCLLGDILLYNNLLCYICLYYISLVQSYHVQFVVNFPVQYFSVQPLRVKHLILQRFHIRHLLNCTTFHIATV